METENGKLYLVATPIGNLEDITYRAIRILGEVDIIAAEDTRRSRILLKHYDINTRMISYHAHNEHGRTRKIISLLEDGKNVAVVADAGTPAIADPGFLLVREAVESGIEPIVIPGPSSLTFSVAAAALPVDKFSFYGFTPVKKGKRQTLLRQITDEGKTAFLFESPHRLSRLLGEIAEIIGSDAKVAIIREATKLHEELIRGEAAQLAEKYAEHRWKGECVVAVKASQGK